jgi:UDP-GlcNAc:undecaprenyl-phosphate/decaprenyl-phosphate GlcNAc-1-phosphate transferase
MPSINLFYIFLTSLFTVLVLVPPISRLAVSIGIFDGPDERKLHTGAIPRLGGGAIFFAVLLGTILFSDIDRHTRGFLAGGAVIFLTGLTDDLTGLEPRKKLLGQFVAALISTVVGDLSLTSLGDLFGIGQIELGYFSVPFTVFAIVGVINAINLLDGLDGLAGGVTAIAATAMGIIAYNTGNQQLVGICVVLLGGVIAFLKFNSYPAKIFMGDGGSLFLGYCLATFSIHLVEHGGGHVSAMVPVIILAVPICDTCFVVVKRLRDRQPIFAPDRSHIHHRLMDLGLGHKATVVLVYGLSYFLAIYAVMFQRLPDQQQLINLVLMLLGFCVLNRFLAHLLLRHTNRFLEDGRSFLNVFTYRWLVRCSHQLLVAVKYLVVAVLSLTIFITSRPGFELASVAGLLIILIIALILETNDWSNRFLQFVLYFNGAFLVYVVENYGRDTVMAGLRLNQVSMYLFIALFFVSGGLLFLRKKSRLLMSSPMEYFILFIVIAVPLLPDNFTGPRHLLTVAGKSMILFLSYKMIFMLKARRNRKVIVATLLALFACGVRSLM